MAAFTKFVLASTLGTCLQQVLFNGNGPCGTFYMIAVNSLINGSVEVTLTFVKKGVKIMYKRLSNSLNWEERFKIDNTQGEAKAPREWVN